MSEVRQGGLTATKDDGISPQIKALVPDFGGVKRSVE
jgi:hypothetical protein